MLNLGMMRLVRVFLKYFINSKLCKIVLFLDMKKMEEIVRKITCDGLLWGAAKLVPLAYGIHKLQISCVVEDDKVSIDWLTEEIEKNEDFVQSVDIAAFNKI